MNTHEVASALDLLLNMVIVMSEGGRPAADDWHYADEICHGDPAQMGRKLPTIEPIPATEDKAV